MKAIWRFAAVAVGSGIALFLALVGYVAVDVYIMGNCEPKFGCFGSTHFASFIAGLMLLCSLSGHVVACLILRNTVRGLSGLRFVGVVVALCIGQGALVASMDNLLPGDSVEEMMIAWAAISAALAIAVLLLVRAWPSNNSFKPKTLRRSA